MKTRWNGIVALLIVSMVAACTTPAPSQLMTNVENDLNSPQRDALEAEFPRLIAEAEAALKKGRKALEEGDSNRSELYVSIANSKYQAALNLSRSTEIGHQQAAYEDALVSLEDEVEFLAREAEELERYNQLQDRFEQATGKLEQYEGMEGDARESLALARKKQGNALREGAPQLAEKAYQEGELLTQSALTALEGGDFESTIELSGQAVTAFDQAIAESKDSAVAQRRRAKESETQQKSRNDERDEALDFIEQAVEMKAAALADGADKKQPNLFQQGDFLLSRAEMAVKDERFDQADESAKKSASSFEKAIKTKVEKPDESTERNAAQTSGETDTRQTARELAPLRRRQPASSASRDEVVRLLTRTQMQRAEALGRGEDDLCPNTFQEFEAVLEIAQQRLDSGDYSSAFEHAIRAQERLRLCTRTDEDTDKQASKASSEQDRSAAPSARSAQAQRAQAASTAQETTSDDADSGQEEEKLSPLERAARDRAIAAMTEADLAIERSEFRGTPRSTISRATSLKESAEKSFENEDYSRATLFADLAVEELSPDSDDGSKRDAQAKKSKDEKTSTASVKEAKESKSSDAKTGPDKQEKVCPENEALANFVEERVRNQKVIQESRGDRSWQPPTSLRAARTLNEQGKCESARGFYQEAASELFDEGEKTPERDEKKTAKTTDTSDSPDRQRASNERQRESMRRDEAPRATTNRTDNSKESQQADEAFRQRALTSLAESQRKLASLGSKSEGPALKLSSRLVRKSESAFDSGSFEDSYVFSQQALGAMESVASTGESTSASTAEWKGPYQKVLDALIARDRAETLVNDKTRDVFDRGVNFLGKARDSWSSKEYGAAEKFAQAASEDFQTVQDNAEEAAKKAAQAEADRKAQAEREEAQRAEEERKKAAQEKASDREQAQRKAAQREQATEEEARQDASKALREASVKFKLCEEKNCRQRDSRGFLTGSEMLEDAREAMNAKNYDEAARLASDAGESFQNVLDMRVELAPATSDNLKVSDGEIVLSPRIKFDLGSTTVSQSSMQSVRALADYLGENKAVLDQIAIIGHTDSKGNADNNRELSRKRAQSVADALRSMGVNSSLLNVVGMGESQPIASNDSAEGRARNRRVEIRYELRSE